MRSATTTSGAMGVTLAFGPEQDWWSRAADASRACSAQAVSMGFDGIHWAFWIGDSTGIDSPLGGEDAGGLFC